MKLKGYAYILTAACLWGIIGPVSRSAFSEGISPLEVAFWRAVIAWACFGTHAVWIKEIRMDRKDRLTIPVFGITGVAMFYGAYQLAVESGGAALASVLLYTAPAWVTLMAAMLFREAVTWMKSISLVLTLAGIIGISYSQGFRPIHADIPVSLAGILFGLLSGFCYSLYYIFGKHFSGRYSAPNLFFYILPIGAAVLLPFVSFQPKTPAAWGALLIIAVVSTYAAYFCYYIGLKYLEASRAAITATMEPVVAALTAFFWWGESFSWIGYAGAFLILTAVVLTVFDSAKSDPEAARPDSASGQQRKLEQA